jgi:hypothetical protein
MIKLIIKWGWVKNKRQANILLLSFSFCCFAISGHFFQKAFENGPIEFAMDYQSFINNN